MSGETGVVVLNGRRYAVERDWGDFSRCPPGRPSHVAVDRAGRLHVLRRDMSMVAVIEPNGAFAFRYGEREIFEGHGISIDAHDRVWVVDRDAHQVLCYTADGSRLSTLGERHSPRWREPFNHPTRVAVSPTGDIYVADGYGNARVHRFDAAGGHLASFGELGRSEGQMMTPHSLIVDRQGRVLVCDREGDRIQIFGADGIWQGAWTSVAGPMDILEQRDGSILVTDRTPALLCFDPDGAVLGRCRPSPNGAHGIAADPAGNLYLAETSPASISRLRLI